MNDTELILDEIRALRKDVREDITAVWDKIEEQRKLSLDIRFEQIYQGFEIEKIKTDQKDTLIKFDNHVNDKDKHYNLSFNEGYWEKMKRKRPEIVTSVTLGGILFGFVLAFLSYIGAI